jgi:succinyl-CoA synthetase beta subunit
MKLLEHEAKAILKKHLIPVPKGSLIKKDSSFDISFPVVIKSQVPIGGRGKAGGIIVVNDTSELEKVIDKLFKLPIAGFLPSSLLAEELISIKKEFYIALFIDRSARAIHLLAHKHGGINIEDNNSADFLEFALTEPSLLESSKKLSNFLDLDAKKTEVFVKNLYQAFVQSDATLLEINPLILTEEDTLTCGDCKMEIDDAALFRHPEFVGHSIHNANFVMLDQSGTIATIANGAGLAMATVDAVADFGMSPANFLDIGGGATTTSVMKAFSQIMEFPRIEAIVINIFAGITRCDEIARAIIEAKQAIPGLPPLFIRLAGTNFEEAVALLTEQNIPTLATLEECLAAAKEVTRG